MALPYKKLTSKNDKKILMVSRDWLVSTSALKSKETRNDNFDMSEE